MLYCYESVRGTPSLARHAAYSDIFEFLFEGERHATTYDERVNLQRHRLCVNSLDQQQAE